MPGFNQKGIAHILLFFVAAAGIVGYILFSQSAEFKDKLFSTLYPKKSSFAAESTRIEVVDSSGNPITTTSSQNVKVKLTYVAPNPTPTSTMNFVKEWGGGGSGNGQFSYLGGITRDANNNIYAIDNGSVAANGKVRIQKFDSEGSFLGEWGSYGNGNGQFIYPTDIAIDLGSGDIYIVDHGVHQGYVHKFKMVPGTDSCSEGTTQISAATTEKVCFVTKWPVGRVDNFPTSASVDSKGNVYVPIGGTPWIEVYDSSGNWRLNWVLSEDYNYNYYLTIDSNNNYYILNYSNSRIKKYDSSGTFITNLDLDTPYSAEGITVDQSGSIYVGFLNKFSKFIFEILKFLYRVLKKRGLCYIRIPFFIYKNSSIYYSRVIISSGKLVIYLFSTILNVIF